MVKKKKEEEEEEAKKKKKKKSALGGTRDYLVATKPKDNTNEEEEEEEEEEFVYSNLEKMATREEGKTLYESGPISNAQLKLYIDVLHKVCQEDKIEQFVKLFAPPDLEEDDRVYFLESLRGTIDDQERWNTMKREIEILKEGKYRGISGDQTRGPVEFRFDMMVDGNSTKKKSSDSGSNNKIHIMREVVFTKTNNVWHAEG